MTYAIHSQEAHQQQQLQQASERGAAALKQHRQGPQQGEADPAHTGSNLSGRQQRRFTGRGSLSWDGHSELCNNNTHKQAVTHSRHSSSCSDDNRSGTEQPTDGCDKRIGESSHNAHPASGPSSSHPLKSHTCSPHKQGFTSSHPPTHDFTLHPPTSSSHSHPAHPQPTAAHELTPQQPTSYIDPATQTSHPIPAQPGGPGGESLPHTPTQAFSQSLDDLAEAMMHQQQTHSQQQQQPAGRQRRKGRGRLSRIPSSSSMQVRVVLRCFLRSVLRARCFYMLCASCAQALNEAKRACSAVHPHTALC